jgi:hypothetical protein
MELLDGSDPAPAKTLEVEDEEKNKTKIPNPSYGVWIARDQQVMSFLLKGFSQDILAHVLGLEHAADVWRTIHALFKEQSRARIGMLRAALVNTKKLDMTATAFISKMKGYASELAAAGRVISDEELKEYLLAGLDGEYNPIVAAANANPATSFTDVCNQLSAYDYRQQMLSESGQGAGTFMSSENAASRGGGPRRGGYNNHHQGGGYNQHHAGGYNHHFRGRPPRRHDGNNYGRRPPPMGGRGRGRGRAPSPHQDLPCQICKKPGHTARDCWWLYADGDDDDDSHTKD